MKFTCQLGAYRDYLLPLAKQLEGIEQIAESFSTATLASGSPKVDLRLDAAKAMDGIGPDRETDEPGLRESMSKLLNPIVEVGNGVDKVALIVGDQWGDSGIFGLMFDQSFNPQIAGGYYPRRGAVVFAKAIKAKRKERDPTSDEVIFTCIHELGHIFNLWHTGTKKNNTNYMTTSDPKKPYPLDKMDFDNKPTEKYISHLDFLNKCEESKFVQPGGSAFGDRGGLGPSGGIDAEAENNAAAAKMRIRTSHPEFLCFEPVQLDVWLTSKVAMSLPNELDPGYDRFDIWIEEPDGARRRYRPTMRYCASMRTRNFLPREQYWRDIPIFGQSGSYTFEKVGTHTVWTVMEISRGRRIVSNKWPFEIIGEPGRSARFRAFKGQLTRPEIAKLLFYHSTDRLPQDVEGVLSACKRWGGNSLGHCHYAIGRACLRGLHGMTGIRRKKRLEMGNDHLKRSQDLDKEGSPRRERAQTIIDKNSSKNE